MLDVVAILRHRVRPYSMFKHGLILILLGCGVVFSLNRAVANEILLPRSHEELQSPTFELAREVVGSEVAYFNRSALVRDFPELKLLNDEQLKSWLLHEASFVGSLQSQLDGIRQTPIPFGDRRVPAFRPPSYVRSMIVEVHSPVDSAHVIGLFDIKGAGHGALSREVIAPQVHAHMDMNKLREKGHSDGLISLGEAIAETTRQQVVQDLFDLTGSALETVETYAIIRLPFNILKANHEIPSALYIRQAHVGRFSNLCIPESIYIDPYGGRQRSICHTAVDFGGVIITNDEAGPLQEQAPNALDYEIDPQKTKAWRWAHDSAQAFVRPHAPDKGVVFRHVDEMTKDLRQKCQVSPVCHQKYQHRQEEVEYVRELRANGLNLASIADNFFSKYGRQGIKDLNYLYNRQASGYSGEHPGEPSALKGESIATIEASFKTLSPQNYRDLIPLADALYGRIEPEALPILQSLLANNSEQVQSLAIRALAVRPEAIISDWLEPFVYHDNMRIRDQAVRALSMRKDSKAHHVIEKYLRESNGGRTEYAAFRQCRYLLQF